MLALNLVFARRVSVRWIVVCCFFSVLASSISRAQSDNARITGTLAYRERIALPSDAVIDIQLQDISLADTSAQVISEAMFSTEGKQVPFPFVLTYDPAKIVASHRYSVRATIRSSDGMLMFATTQAYPVITNGAPTKVTLLLHTVGHGAAPKVPKKKPAQIPPSTENAAPEPPTPIQVQQTEAAAAEKAVAPPQPTETAVPGKSPSPPAEPVAPTAETNPAVVPPPSPSQTAIPSQADADGYPPRAESVESASNLASTKSQESLPTKEATAEAAKSGAPKEKAPAEAAASAEPAMGAPAQPPAAPHEPAAAEPALPDAPSAATQPETSRAGPEAPIPSEATREVPATSKPLPLLADTQWRLLQLQGKAIVLQPTDRPMTLAFSPEGTRIAGSAGCNRYLGTYTENRGHLQLDPGGMTLMACADPAMQRERNFIAMLRSVDSFRITGSVLSLTSKGRMVAKFQNQLSQ